MHDELDPLLYFGQFFGQGCLAKFDTSSSLIDEIDGLVRKETVRNVAAGMGD